MNPFRYRGNRRRPGAHGEMPLVCRMCSPLRFFTFYEHLRAHLRSVHAIRDLSREQISLYESYPGSRNEMRHFVSNTRQGGARQASQNDNVLPSMISNAVSVGVQRGIQAAVGGFSGFVSASQMFKARAVCDSPNDQPNSFSNKSEKTRLEKKTVENAKVSLVSETTCDEKPNKSISSKRKICSPVKKILVEKNNYDDSSSEDCHIVFPDPDGSVTKE